MDKESILDGRKVLKETDNYFEALEFLNEGAFGKGVIPKKYKELMGLALAINFNSEENIQFHLNSCKELDCTKQEIVETFKVVVASGGNLVLPYAAKALKYFTELEVE